MEINSFSPKARLILSLIHLSGGSLPGITRMQKLALLTSKDIEKSYPEIEVFTDWVPDNYGGRSTLVYASKDELIRRNAITEKEGMIRGKKTKIYTLTEYGKELSKELDMVYGDKWDAIAKIVARYVKGSTPELIALSYQKYRDLTINSKIIQEVNKQLLKKLSPLSPMYEGDVGVMPAGLQDKRKEKIRTEAEDDKFFKSREFEMQKLPDIEARKKLAALAGLKDLPKLDPMAIYRLDGIISKDLGKNKKFDSVELVRSVRGD